MNSSIIDFTKDDPLEDLKPYISLFFDEFSEEVDLAEGVLYYQRFINQPPEELSDSDKENLSKLQQNLDCFIENKAQKMMGDKSEAYTKRAEKVKKVFKLWDDALLTIIEGNQKERKNAAFSLFCALKDDMLLIPGCKVTF